MGVEIILTWAELWQAAIAGCSRRIISMKNGLNKDLHSPPGISTWATDIDGAAAELAFAKGMGLFWCAGVNTFKNPDVGEFQVRSTPRRTGHLIVRLNDSPEDRFFLVISNTPRFRIVGSTLGKDAKNARYWRESDPDKGGAGAYWIPQEDLEPYHGE
jgi:hypothetical protein